MNKKRVLILQQESNEAFDVSNGGSWSQTEIITLPHPKYSSQGCKFLVNRARTELLQIQSAHNEKGNYGSWFHAHEQVISGGELYVCTPFDISFLMLPLLEKAQYPNNRVSEQEKLQDLDQDEETTSPIEKQQRQQPVVGLFCEEDDLIDKCFQSNEQLIYMMRPFLKKFNCLHNLCESKELPGTSDKAYRISEKRVLKWLKIKSDIVAQALMNNRDFMAQNSNTKTFRKSLKKPSEQNVSEEQLKRQAIVQSLKVLSDNISLKWMKLLAEKLDVSEYLYPKPADLSFATVSSHSQSDGSQSSSTALKRKRTEEDEKPAKKKATESRSLASLKKVDTSKMKSITSFFSPKKKAPEE